MNKILKGKQMNHADLRKIVRHILLGIAPELENCVIDDNAPLREFYELDSIDYMNFILRLHDALGIDVPETDYSSLTSLGDTVTYLAERLESSGGMVIEVKA